MATPSLTDKPCPRCLSLAQKGRLRPETVQRLPPGAMAPLARDGSGKCCFDCASAEGVMRRISGMDFEMARIAVANDRQEQYRLPGASMGLVAMGLVRPSGPLDFKEQSRWLQHHPEIFALEEGS